VEIISDYTVRKIKAALAFFTTGRAQPLKVAHNQGLIIFDVIFIEAKYIKQLLQKIGSIRPVPVSAWPVHSG
jgi:sulfite reductase beta subunit-like hemoprotein